MLGIRKTKPLTLGLVQSEPASNALDSNKEAAQKAEFDQKDLALKPSEAKPSEAKPAEPKLAVPAPATVPDAVPPAVAPPVPAASFGFEQKAPRVEMYIDPSLLNLVEQISPRLQTSPGNAAKPSSPPQPESKLEPAAAAPAPKTSPESQTHIRFRPLATANLRIPLPERSSQKEAAQQKDAAAQTDAPPAGAPKPASSVTAETPPLVERQPVKPANAAAPDVKTSSRPAMGPSKNAASLPTYIAPKTPPASQEPAPAAPASSGPEAVKSEATKPAAEILKPQAEGFEIVLGRRQIASVLFVMTALIMLTASLAYVAGKASVHRAPDKREDRTEDKREDKIADTAAEANKSTDKIADNGQAGAPASEALVEPIKPAPVAAPAPSSTASTPPAFAAGKPIFSVPVRGKAYLQVTAVEKGMAEVIAQGFRARGLEAFAAPTPSSKLFRVLIGPLADQASYLRAKDTVDDLGLSAFAHRFQE